jgi:hypothetical protein
LDIDFHIKLNQESLLQGNMSMKWKKENCIEKKESLGIVTRWEPKVGFDDCFKQQMMTSKIPCDIDSNFDRLFTFELDEKGFLTCLDKGIWKISCS